MDVLATAELTVKFEESINEIGKDLTAEIEQHGDVDRVRKEKAKCSKFNPFSKRLWSYTPASSLAYKMLKIVQSWFLRDVKEDPDAIWWARYEKIRNSGRKIHLKLEALRAEIRDPNLTDDHKENINDQGSQLYSELQILKDKLNAILTMDQDKLREHNLHKMKVRPIITMVEGPSTLEDNNNCRMSAYAGRVQNMGNGGKPSAEVVKLQMIDITSTYPTRMCHDLFPYGIGQKTDRYIPGKLGYYWCTVIRQPEITIIPKRPTKGSVCQSNDWTYTGEMQCWVNTVDIDNIRKHGGEVNIHHGVYYRWASRDQFRNFITPLYKLKQHLDMAKGTPLANPAKREAVKLILNSISGKVCEHPHFEVAKLSGSESTSVKILKQVKWETVNLDTNWSDAVFISGTMTDEAKVEKYRRDHRRGKVSPTITGGLIYSYAREALYLALEYAGELGYCDTDSVTMSVDSYNRFSNDYPDLMVKPGKPKELGQWECELKQSGTINYELIRVAPKEYGIFDPTGKEDPKIRTKGVRARDLRITIEERDKLASMNHIDRAEWAHRNQSRSFGNTFIAQEAFRDRVNGKSTYWLCTQAVRQISSGAGVVFRQIIKKYG